MTAVKKTAAPKTDKAADFAMIDGYTTVENISNAARDQFEKVAAAYAENAEAFRGQAEEMMETVRGNFESARTRFNAVNTDLVNSAREEAAEAVDFFNNLARAKSVADALEIQRDYWTNLFETRIERTQAMTKATVEAARESFEPFSKSLSAFSTNAAFDKFNPFSAK
ncbi:MAG: phasin family protein [Parvularculaceae bacterium]